MYAVIETGGKQYRVAPGESVRVETLAAEAGQTIELDRVLMISDGQATRVGRPFVEGGKVTATITQHGRHPKVKIIKFRRRKHHMKQMGHRQNFTEIRIDAITG